MFPWEQKTSQYLLQQNNALIWMTSCYALFLKTSGKTGSNSGPSWVSRQQRFKHSNTTARTTSRNKLFQMFVAWRRKQTNDSEAKGKLAEALNTIDRADMASEISGKMTKYFKFIRIVTRRGKFKSKSISKK